MINESDKHGRCEKEEPGLWSSAYYRQTKVAGSKRLPERKRTVAWVTVAEGRQSELCPQSMANFQNYQKHVPNETLDEQAGVRSGLAWHLLRVAGV